MLNVCVLGQANPFAWMPHYVAAFREVCNVVTVGPRPDSAVLKEWKREHLAGMIQPHDVEIPLDATTDLSQVLPRGWEPDLVVSISGGGIPMFINTCSLRCPAVFISVDTWQCLADYSEARFYDVVFTAQREFVEHLRATGSRHVYWLPLACNPDAHFPVPEQEETDDIAFVGAASLSVHAERARLLRLLEDNFSVIRAERVHGAEMCRIFARGRLAFNHAAVRELNMRIFEVLAMGRPLLTNSESAYNGLLDLFEEDKHLIIYRDEKDLLKKACRYLENEKLRLDVATAGRAEVLANHTYRSRVQALIAQVRALYPHLGQRDSRSPLSVSENILDWLPRIPGRVLDFGMSLPISRYSAKRLGVIEFVGASADRERRDRRRGSYTAIFESLGSIERDSFDTVVISDESDFGGIASTMSELHRILVPGGTIVGCFFSGLVANCTGRPASLTAWKEWLLQSGFHATFVRALSEGYWMISARKRTGPLREIVYRIFSELNVPGFPAEEVASLISPDM